MFAYCGNDPVICVDPEGTIHYSVSPTAQFCKDVGNKPYIIPDNKYTKRSGIINGQGICPYADESMGLGNYAGNGCGVIGIYNVMQLLEKPQLLGSIENELWMHGGMLFGGGLLGVMPWSIDNYFAEHDIACKGYDSYRSFSQDLYEGAVVMVLVVNNVDNIFDGMHYVAAQYIGGQYIVYNISNSYPDSYSLPSMEQPYGNIGFLHGYIIGG